MKHIWILGILLTSIVSPARYPVVAPKPLYTLSGPHRSYDLSFVPENPVLDERVVQCESQGVNISRPDSNNRISDGVAQFNRGEDGTIQSGTWGWMEKLSGLTGDPRIPDEAIEMLDWAISNGYGPHWTCYRRIMDLSTR